MKPIWYLLNFLYTKQINLTTMSTHNYLAFDLGAESGRAIVGKLSDGILQLAEVNRFSNSCLDIRGRYHWDIFRLFEELKNSLEICSKSKVESIAIDTWGVDFGLLAKDGSLISMPYAYRDHQTDGIIDEFTKEIMSKKDLYLKTGIQLMQFNTIFQLYAMRKNMSPLLGIATDLLFTPDLLNYLFTGILKSEFTIATTSQLLDPLSRDWDQKLFDSIGIAREIVHSIIYPGTVIGQIDKEICLKAGIQQIPLVAVASHDTASAIAAVPAKNENWAYLSSGTWSLMGIETNQPIINKASADYEFTNEGGVDGKYCFLKNLCGLWLLQQCKKSWDIKNSFTYDQLTQMAEQVEPFKILIDTDAPEFYNPKDMPEAIQAYCNKTKQSVPLNPSDYVQCIFDSLALKYKMVLEQLNKFSPKPIEVLYVIGGGAKNKTLCQLTANALGIPVITGPSEATAIGNIMMQAKALGHVSSLAEIRSIINKSFASETYLPKDTEKWEKMYRKYLKIVNNP